MAALPSPPSSPSSTTTLSVEASVTGSPSLASKDALPSWAIMASVAVVCPTDADLPPGGKFSLALDVPPRVSVLKISRGLFPEDVRAHCFPKVLAADPSGILLLHADQGAATGPVFVDLPDGGGIRSPAFISGYFVLDTTTGSTFALPNPELIHNRDHVGLVSTPERYFVAELQHSIGLRMVKVLVFKSDDASWSTQEFPNPIHNRRLAPHGHLSHMGKIWWIDLSAGLITVDPAGKHPGMRFVPLPAIMTLPEKMETWASLQSYRCIAVSAGKIRLGEMFYDHTTGEPSQVLVWTLADPEAGVWTQDYQIFLTDLQAQGSYEAAGLPNRIPSMALFHPSDASLIYFNFGNTFFCVNLETLEVLQSETSHEMVQPASYYLHTGPNVFPWMLPSNIAPGLIMKLGARDDASDGNPSNEPSKLAAAAGIAEETDCADPHADQIIEYLKDPSKYAGAAQAAAAPSAGAAAATEEEKKEESDGESDGDGLGLSLFDD